MRLVSFNGQRVGVLKGQRVVDVTGLVPGDDRQWPPVAMIVAIASFPDLAAKLEEVARAEQGVPLSSVKLAAPVQWPNKVIAYPTNYDDHITEMRSAGRSDRHASARRHHRHRHARRRRADQGRRCGQHVHRRHRRTDDARRAGHRRQ